MSQQLFGQTSAQIVDYLSIIYFLERFSDLNLIFHSFFDGNENQEKMNVEALLFSSLFLLECTFIFYSYFAFSFLFFSV